MWSCGVILYVLLTGRPPFARPLAKTYGKNLKRCKHFCRLIKGLGYEGISENAKHLLMQIFQEAPESRPSLSEIRHHPWFNGPLPDPMLREKVMEQKAMEVWHAQHKPHMSELLSMLRHSDRVAPAPAPSPIESSKNHASTCQATIGPAEIRWLGLDPMPSPCSSFQSPATPIMFTPHGGVSSFMRPFPPEFQLPPQATITEESDEPRAGKSPGGAGQSSSPFARSLGWGLAIHPLAQATDHFDAMSFADDLDHEEKKKLH